MEISIQNRKNEEILENTVNTVRLELEKSSQDRQKDLRLELQHQHNLEMKLIKENASVETMHAVESATQLLKLEFHMNYS